DMEPISEQILLAFSTGVKYIFRLSGRVDAKLDVERRIAFQAPPKRVLEVFAIARRDGRQNVIERDVAGPHPERHVQRWGCLHMIRGRIPLPAGDASELLSLLKLRFALAHAFLGRPADGDIEKRRSHPSRRSHDKALRQDLPR